MTEFTQPVPQQRQKNPKEYEVVALRECPLPDDLQLCDTAGFQDESGDMLESESLQRTESDPPVRTLKIEAEGDRWIGIKPKIRLMGRWLERAGFRPGNRVHVECVAPGMIELRAFDAAMNQSKLASSERSEHPF